MGIRFKCKDIKRFNLIDKINNDESIRELKEYIEKNIVMRIKYCGINYWIH